MEEPMKGLLEELGKAINDCLTDSDRIGEAIGKIRKAGYDVFLVLEATIGFSKHNPDDENPEQYPVQPPNESAIGTSGGKVKFTARDHTDAHKMGISLDRDYRRPNKS